ncbi:cytidylyltransferase domain-containing protein [Labrenzia sp. VG12]|uniref:acylneuraminate cytidylyltransferase family protein n=1 Tax=Labrenzia sp. VG12 TaxID=2021862 RepID=UPI000B8C2A18|nr:hypothetical protein [Labrenzia sp. VG12]ASP35874.1 acylneuraminate cytidylyltransferase [Labrenzia sp. VG12]
MTGIQVFLPCRKGSLRVPDKNTRQFASDGRSLLDIKLEQLQSTDGINSVLLSTNDEAVEQIARRYIDMPNSKIVLDNRPDEFCGNNTTTDEVISYAATVLTGDHILWTHVTSPFLGPEGYAEVIDRYQTGIASGKYDSAMTAKRLQTFLWNEEGPQNYDPSVVAWPRTQTLQVLWEIDSGAFVAPVDIYRNRKNRIGSRPNIIELSGIASLDVDTQTQFELAQSIWNARENN